MKVPTCTGGNKSQSIQIVDRVDRAVSFTLFSRHTFIPGTLPDRNVELVRCMYLVVSSNLRSRRRRNIYSGSWTLHSFFVENILTAPRLTASQGPWSKVSSVCVYIFTHSWKERARRIEKKVRMNGIQTRERECYLRKSILSFSNTSCTFAAFCVTCSNHYYQLS